MTTCDEREAQISDLISGGLDEKEAKELEEHLRGVTEHTLPGPVRHAPHGARA